jgi:hypothetical protein
MFEKIKRKILDLLGIEAILPKGTTFIVFREDAILNLGEKSFMQNLDAYNASIKAKDGRIVIRRPVDAMFPKYTFEETVYFKAPDGVKVEGEGAALERLKENR